jgi:hypothetical protein
MRKSSKSVSPVELFGGCDLFETEAEFEADEDRTKALLELGDELDTN